MSESGKYEAFIRANQKVNAPNTRFEDVKVRETAHIDICAVSEATGNRLLAQGKAETLAETTQVRVRGESYSCSRKIDARWRPGKTGPSQPITLFVAAGMPEDAVFPKGTARQQTTTGAIAPLEFDPKTPEQKDRDDKRNDKAKKVSDASVASSRESKRAKYSNATKDGK